jgi:TolA-binding protein
MTEVVLRSFLRVMVAHLRPNREKFLSTFGFLGVLSVQLLGGFACSVDTARSHYILAEKLWMDRSYAAAVTEFEKVIAKDPRGKLGMQATYRAANTQALFLSEYAEAVKKFRLYAQGPVDPQSAWEAKVQIGEILFTKTEQYDQTIAHYQLLLRERPRAPEAPEFLYRIGKSWFFLLRFSDALASFQEIVKDFPTSPWAEKAAFETGVTYFTRGEQQGEKEGDPYQEALVAYQSFVRKYPKSSLVPEARFGIAACMEEKGQLEQAYGAYSSLKAVYPSPRVIEIKLARLKERVAHKGGFK